jgi:hypothetical protein
MEYYSAMKTTDIITWMDLKGITMSEKRPTSKGYILYGHIYIILLK